MAGLDTAFKRVFRWFDAAADALEAPLPDPLKGVASEVVRERLGLRLDANPDTLSPDSFGASTAAAESLATATMVAGETMAALKLLGHVLADQSFSLGDVAAIVQQIDRITSAAPAKPPSAYSIGKLLLVLSGDADSADASEAPALRLVRILTGQPNLAPGSPTFTTASNTLALVIMVLGTILDRSFSPPSTSDAIGWSKNALPPLPNLNPGTLFDQTLVWGGPSQTLQLLVALDDPVAPAAAFARLTGSLAATRSFADGDYSIGLSFGTNLAARISIPPLKPPPNPLPVLLPPQLDKPQATIALTLKRASDAHPIRIGDVNGTHLDIGELSGGLVMEHAAPKFEFGLRKGRLTLKVGDDALLSTVLGDTVTVDFNFGLIADTRGGLRVTDGTGLRATIPLEKIPVGPFQIPYLTFALEPVGQPNLLDDLRFEFSGTFQVTLGPFSGSVERLGVFLHLEHMLAGQPQARFELKPPNGAGLAISAGPVTGGGFLLFDPDRGEYGGVLDVKLAGIGVKAIGLLSTKNPGGWSLLLVIAAQLPPIQLSWGFTLTGVGGLIGVQHTVSLDALGQGLTSGSLDSFLFPDNPVANAPTIINQLRVIFPFKPGGFVIGPMLEVGWGTPNLVTIRIGVLIEATQIALVGQAIVQVPPLVDAGLAILRLQVDFLGALVFDPFKIRFDGVLRNSRVGFITITGQFAFRADFGDKPTFLISAGGFHPRFTDIPSDVPSPFQRIGASFDIGIVGVSLYGYFAVTSATVQAGAGLRVWADVGVASFEGGFEFDAICYLSPRFRFEVDMHVYAHVEVFDLELCGIDIRGMLAGPGRWRARGTATLELPLFLPDVDIDFDESWGDAVDTPVVKLRLADELKKEVAKLPNWTAQLPLADESFATVAAVEATDVLLAHPNAVLKFVQTLLPLGKTLDKLGTNGIEGDRLVRVDDVIFGTAPPAVPGMTLHDHFAAAQFLELSDDDRLTKPSFDRFDAGFAIATSQYVFGAAVPEAYDYEEVDLSAPASLGFLGRAVFRDVAESRWAINLGAAARSPRRHARDLTPADASPARVEPPAYTAATAPAGIKAALAGAPAAITAQALAGTARQSFWLAAEALQGQQAAQRAAGLAQHLVEAFELAEVG